MFPLWDFLALPLDEKLDHTEADQGYDSFDDAYTRFAGRGAWGRGFDAEQL